MKDSLRSKADTMVEVYGQLRKKFFWRANDVSLRFAGCIYSLTGKTFDLERYDNLLAQIKKQTGYFSYFRSTLLYPIAAQLVCQFEHPEQAFSDLLDYDRLLKANGFKGTAHRGIAAYALLLTCPPGEIDTRINRAREIYQRMKENHFWLTSSDDYGVAVLLAAEKDDLHSLVQRMEENYEHLRREGFRRSNGLQLLSHLLTFSPEPAEVMAGRCREIADFLKARKLGLSSMYYGGIGLLALLGKNSDDALADLVDMVGYLKEKKEFKFYYREMNVLMVSALVGTEYTEEKKQGQLGTTSIGIAVEALIAAQAAAIIAATSAAAAAGASSSAR